MIPWVKKLFFSEEAFVSYARAALLMLGMVAQEGKLGIPGEYDWVGYVLMAAAVFLRAGEKNQTVERAGVAPAHRHVG